MDLFLRFTATAALVLGLAVGVGLARPVWVADLGLDYWHLSDYSRQMHAEAIRGVALDRELRGAKVLEKRKEAVLLVFVDGRVTLEEALRRMTDLVGADVLCRAAELHPGVLPGDTPAEPSRDLLLYWADRYRRNDPMMEPASKGPDAERATTTQVTGSPTVW